MEKRLWSTPKTNQRDRQRYFDSFRQKRSLISNADTSSSDNTEDEEWIQQLERDYGRRSHINRRKTKWTRLEKVLTFSLMILLFLVIFLLTALVYSKYKHSDESLLEFTLGGQKYCNTEGCVQASNRVVSYADKSRDPCDSFYDYTCTRWAKDFGLGPDDTAMKTHTKLTSFTEVSDRNQRLLKNILDSIQNKTQHHSEALEKVRLFYKSCQRSDFVEANGNKSLHWLIDYVGSWAMTTLPPNEWNEEKWSFGQALTKIHHLKSMPLFYMYVAPDDRNSSHNIIQVNHCNVDKKYSTLSLFPRQDV